MLDGPLKLPGVYKASPAYDSTLGRVVIIKAFNRIRATTAGIRDEIITQADMDMLEDLGSLKLIFGP